MYRFTSVTLCSAVALLSMANFADFLSHTPAFDADSQKTGVLGEWQVGLAPALYNRSDYLFQLGHGFTASDSFVTEVDDDSTVLADIDEMSERANEAKALIAESLALAPGNAHAWATLAWAHGLDGETEEARAALNASWSLAPHNYELALSRLGLTELFLAPALDLETLEDIGLSDEELADETLLDDTDALFESFAIDVIELTEAERAAVAKDLETARRYSKRLFQEYIEDVPLFAELAATLPPLDGA